MNKITTKINILGLFLIVLILSITSTTIYLNSQTSKDALIVNIVGKQRMLTQKIAKNIFYTYYTKTYNLSELNSAVDEFKYGLNTLQYGDIEKGISPVKINSISSQLTDIKKQWNEYYEYIQNYKMLVTQNKPELYKKELEIIIKEIHNSNPIFLENVDKLVSMYTEHSESKISNITLIQYISIFIFLTIFTYSLMQLRAIKSHIDSFLNNSKQLAQQDNDCKLTPIELEDANEDEILEVGNTINQFINKINSAVEYSNNALVQSQNASSKLEELTEEFDKIIGSIKDSSISNKYLNNSEDIIIESSEELMNSIKKLQRLQNQLQELSESCQNTL